MIYTQLTNKAMQIAYRAHHGQTDRSGVPYVFHPFHLAEQMETEETTVAALLHDVAEDTELTLDDLREMGIPEWVLEALALLTHDPAVPYRPGCQTGGPEAQQRPDTAEQGGTPGPGAGGEVPPGHGDPPIRKARDAQGVP